MELNLKSFQEDEDDNVVDDDKEQRKGRERFPVNHRFLEQTSNDTYKGDIFEEQLPHSSSIINSRSLSNDDDGSVIDILCLYTREALEARCEALGGRKCTENYSQYKDIMNDKCQFAVHQTVSKMNAHVSAYSVHIRKLFDLIFILMTIIVE